MCKHKIHFEGAGKTAKILAKSRLTGDSLEQLSYAVWVCRTALEMLCARYGFHCSVDTRSWAEQSQYHTQLPFKDTLSRACISGIICKSVHTHMQQLERMVMTPAHHAWQSASQQ